MAYAWLHMSLVMRKPAFCICENKNPDQLIGAFVFVIRIVQSVYYLNPKFQASSHLLWLYSPVCVEPGRKPLRPVFSQRGSYYCKLYRFWCNFYFIFVHLPYDYALCCTFRNIFKIADVLLRLQINLLSRPKVLIHW